MNVVKCEECNHFRMDDEVVALRGRNLCYTCYKVCRNCNEPHTMTNDYCYSCLEGELIVDYRNK